MAGHARCAARPRAGSHPRRARIGSFAVRDVIAAAFMTIAMMCSGVALPMLLAVALDRARRRGWRVAVATVAVPRGVVRHLVPGVRSRQSGSCRNGTTHGAAVRVGRDHRRDRRRRAARGDRSRRRVGGGGHGSSCSSSIGRSIVTSPFRWRSRSGVAFLAGTGYRRGNLLGPTRRLPLRLRDGRVLLPLDRTRSRRGCSAAACGAVSCGVAHVVLVVAQVRGLHHQTDLAPSGKGQRPWYGAGDRGGRTRRPAFLLESTTQRLRTAGDGRRDRADVSRPEAAAARRSDDGRSPHGARPARPLRRPRSGRAGEHAVARHRVGSAISTCATGADGW